jgi:hypothetical protein
LYFSCKTYQELAPARIKKVVGYFITNPTKFVLNFSDFSTIFYTIYKKWEKSLHYLSYQIAKRPSERILSLQCGPWGCRPARVERIPASSSPAWPGKGGGRVYGLLGLGLRAWLGRGAAGGAGTPAARGGGRCGCLFRRGAARGEEE